MIGQADICMKRTEFDLFHDTLQRANVNRVIGSGYHAGNSKGYLQMMQGAGAPGGGGGLPTGPPTGAPGNQPTNPQQSTPTMGSMQAAVVGGPGS